MLYADASALVPLYAPEPRSNDVFAAILNGVPLVVSTWTITESRSAFALKVRTGVFTAEQAATAAARLEAQMTIGFSVIAVQDDDVVAAGRYLKPENPPLRAADALHLAIARRIGAELLSLDAQMITAARRLGIAAAVV